ncbi:hypothetical protein [Oryza sativa Japonica Group]|uniref:Uncharacterized protein n=5 Tax=Oryza TaxID=4527 RepID=Q5N907_ORYSJ|nr:hypothetical protein OsI_04501 [Oryza sativa Indica Group]EAZ14210.1 hypothetical protein OsJ_04134 [Oryza sativa Japonica Group]BAD82052.1 hypothetical protein [Oryza sativa Japonica Group]
MTPTTARGRTQVPQLTDDKDQDNRTRVASAGDGDSDHLEERELRERAIAEFQRLVEYTFRLTHTPEAFVPVGWTAGLDRPESTPRLVPGDPIGTDAPVRTSPSCRKKKSCRLRSDGDGWAL